MDELIHNNQKENIFRKISSFIKTHKKLSIISGLVLLAVILVGVGLFFTLRTKPAAQPAVKTPIPTAQSVVAQTLYPGILDGVMTDKESSQRHPLAIIVENHPDARPQAGLTKASVVYEAIAEGGITRFLAVFGTNQADKVGPVRSARTYFVNWAEGYNAFFGHVGGNMDALDKIKADKVYDLDEFAFGNDYWREGTGVAIEHTAFTSTENLWNQAAKLNYPTANNFTVYKFKDDPTGATQQQLPDKQTITVNFSSDSYKVVFDYDKSTNSYKRSVAGQPAVDRVTKDQVTPKNVIVMTVPRTTTMTRINEPGYNFASIGSGKAKIFFDGKEIDGTWKKNSPTDREVFYDADGKEISFDRGQTWISVINGETGQGVTVTQ